MNWEKYTDLYMYNKIDNWRAMILWVCFATRALGCEAQDLFEKE